VKTTKRRYGFFALVDPLVVSAIIASLVHIPTGRVAYHFIAGCVMQLMPALPVALADQIAEWKGPGARAGCCAGAGIFRDCVELYRRGISRGRLP
jgi:hypothetical protein